MNLDLYRQVTIDIIDVYAVLLVKRKSPDLQDYLCKELSVPEIDRYLKSIEVYDKSRNLTKLGKQLKEKGEIFQSEEGKYRFYLISNDPMLKAKLLYFKRQKPEAGQKSLNQNPYKEVEINQTAQEVIVTETQENKKEVSEIFIKELSSFYEQIGNQELRLEWKFKFGKQDTASKILTTYFFQGSIKGELEQLNPFKFSYKLERKVLENLFEKLGFQLGEENKVKVKFERERFQEEEWQNFRVYKFPLSELEFGLGKWNGEIRDMEILPSDKESAIKWAELLIDLELRKKYLAEKEWNSLQETVLKRTEFESFRLESVPLTQKLQSLKKAGEKPIEFFHLATPYHLNPYKKERALDKFTVTETTEGDLKKVVLEKLHCPTSKIKILIYSDRYVQSSSQREKFQEVVNYFSTFSSSLKVILLSISKSNQTNFQFAPNVKCGFQELKKGIDNHERFLLIQYEDKYWDIWKITHGIDFFERVNGIYKYKNCSFIKLETSELPNYLKDLYHEFN